MGQVSLDRVVGTRELRARIRSGLNAMPAPWRRLFLLRYVLGTENEELARSLGKPRREVERILAQARQSLCRSLAGAPAATLSSVSTLSSRGRR
jgi:DNA-directed RNA polymerase specialized sigma24 family protein